MLFSNFNILEILYRIPGILIAISMHEWAHAYAAYKCGDPTARNLGRMTIDPTRHFSLLGTISLLLVGWGWAKPVPINPRNFKRPKRDEIFVSLAGVVTNFILAFLFCGVYMYLMYRGVDSTGIAMELILYAMIINISLCFFNLIPIPPLDGSHILKVALGKYNNYKVWEFLERYGVFVLFVILMSGFLDTPLTWLITKTFNLFAAFYNLIF